MKPPKRRWLGVVRAMHIYLTLLSILLFLFFGATGFMLNHGEWFGLEEVVLEEQKGTIPRPMLAPLDRLAVVERLRAEFGATGALDAFQEEDSTLLVVFRSPRGRTDAEIKKGDGATHVTREHRGTIAMLARLHTGEDTGEGWRWLIDGASLLLLLASVTGLTLWLTLPSRRRVGLAALVTGVASFIVAYFAFVP